MRRALVLAGLVLVVALAASPAQGGNGKGPSGIAGRVVNSNCPGPCIYPPPPPPTYTGGDLIVQVRRVADGELMATLTPAEGTFRVKVKRGLYDVSASTAQPTPEPTPQPSPQTSQPAPGACWQGDTERVRVQRHRFTQVELQLQNACVL